MAAEDCEEEIRRLQAGEDRRGSCASMNAASHSVVDQLFHLGGGAWETADPRIHQKVRSSED